MQETFSLLSNKRAVSLELKDFLFFLYIFCLTCGYGRLTNYIAAILSVLVFALCFKSSIKSHPNIVICFFVFYLYHVLTSLFYITDFYYFIGTNVFGVFNRFVPIFLALTVFQYNPKHKKCFLKTLVFLWIIIAAVSTITYLNTEGGGRVYTNNNFGSLLGGGYAAAYASALFAVIILGYVVSSKKILVGWLIIFVLLSLHVFVTNSMITTAAFIVGLLLTLFFHGKKGKQSLIGNILVIAFIVLIFVILLNSETIGSHLITFSGTISNETYSKRVLEIGQYLYSNNESFHIGKRISTITISWFSFLKRPVFGGGYLYGNNFILLKENEIVGYHSELLDLLAEYGMFSIPVLLIFVYGLKTITKSSSIRIAIPFVSTFAIMFCLNPFITDQTIYAMFLLIPLFAKVREDESRYGVF